MPENLPGYVWDAERQRYFRTLNSGLAPVTQSESAHAANNSIAFKRATEKKVSMQDYTIAKIGCAARSKERRRVKAVAQNLGLVGNARLPLNRVEPFAQFGRTCREFGSVDRIASLRQHEGFLFGVSEAGNFSIKSMGAGSTCFRTENNGDTYFTDMDINGPANMLSVCTQDSHTANPKSYGYVFHLGTGEQLANYRISDVINCSTLSDNRKLIFGCDRGIYVGDDFRPTKSGFTALCRGADGIDIAGSRRGYCWSIDERESKLIRSVTHSSCVTNIVSTRGDCIIVSGVDDKLARYDLRFPAHPVLEYPCYSNSSALKHGIALDRRSTTLAVAMDDCQIGLWEAESGRALTSPQLGEAFPKGSLFPCLLWSAQDLMFTHQPEVYKVTTSRVMAQDEFSRRVAEMKKKRDENAYNYLLEPIKHVLDRE